MKNENIIATLNELIIVNNDRIIGYLTASKVTEELDIKTLFKQFILTSQKCKKELEIEVLELGGKIANGTEKTSRKFLRLWMDIIKTLRSKDRKEILNSCNYGEDNTKDAYDMVIEYEFKNLNKKQKLMIVAQMSLIKKDYDRIKLLQEY